MKRILLPLSLLFCLLMACQRQPAPVAVPTVLPVLEPTVLPTAVPTLVPTAVPTLVPTPAPTPLPETLTVELETPYDLTSFPANGSLVFHFNQPMEHATVRQPLRITPQLTGQYGWDDTNTTLTFTPTTTMASGTAYVITVARQLVSSAGQKAPTNLSWRITSPGSLALGITPNLPQLTNPQPTLAVRFNQAVDQETATAALSLRPALRYEVTWVENTMLIALQEPLTLGKSLTVSLAKTVLSTTGLPLSRAYTFTYSLVEPHLTALGPTEGNRTAPVSLALNYTADPATITPFLRWEPAVAGDFEWNAAQDKISFVPEAGYFLSGQVYTLTLTADVPLTGGLFYPAGELVTVGPLTPILKTIFEPLNEEGVSQYTILFDQPMDPTTTAAALSFSPAVEGEISWPDAQTMRFTAALPFSYYTTYEIALKATTQLATGQLALRTPYRETFRNTIVNSYSFGVGSGVQVVEADGRRAVQFAAYDPLAEVTAELFALSLPEFAARYESYKPTEWWGEYEARRFNTAAFTPTLTLTAADMVKMEQSSELVLPPELASGLYVISLRDSGRLNDQLLLVITDNTLLVKQDRTGALAVWVTRINDAAVRPAVQVSVYGRDAQLLASATTDAAGLATLALPPHTTPFMVVAEDGTDISMTGLGGRWSEYISTTGAATADYAATLYTERPIYQPGQTLYYKAIIRTNDDALLANPSDTLTATVRIRDARGNLLQTFTHTTNSFGSLNGSFTIAEGGMLGIYKVELAIEGGNGRRAYATSQVFKVEEYRKPDYLVTVTTDKPFYFPGETVSVTVQARYFFDQPVPNATIQIQLYDRENYYYDYYSDNYGDVPTWYVSDRLNESGRTDADGRFTFTFPAPNFANSYDDGYSLPRPTNLFLLEAVVDDGSAQAVAGSLPVTVYRANESATLRSTYIQNINTPFTVEAAVLDLANIPVSGRKLALTMARYDHTSGDFGSATQQTLTTNGAGVATAEITLPQRGYYRLTLRGQDAGGRVYTTIRYVYVLERDALGGYFYTGYQSNRSLTLVLDRETYAPGDTAVLGIISTVSGPALLTWQRGTLHGAEVITLTAPLTVLDIPVRPEDAPNVYLAVSTWISQPVQALTENQWDSLPDGYLASGAINLRVPVTDKTLTVTITPDRTDYAPRQEATFTVRVTNALGEPVSAELSLGMVDEAIYALSADLSQPLYDSFYFERRSDVTTSQSLRPTRNLTSGGYGGGGDGGANEASPRRDFPDTAAWFPALTTNGNGEAQVTVTLPDSLTTWRLTARAITADTQIGETTASVVVDQKVIVRPLLPRTLTAGDTILISAMVHNYNLTGVNLSIELTSSDSALLQVVDEPAQTVALFPDQARMIGWQISAVAAGEVQLTLIARQDGEVLDAIQLPLTIHPLAVADPQVQVGQMGQGGRDLAFTLPATALPNSTIQLEVSRSIAGTMLEGLDYLTGFPYGCVEQTMSRALPNAVVGRAFNQLGYSTSSFNTGLESKINAGVQRLYGFQHTDGGWGWWYDDNSDDYQTAWVVFGLINTAEAGYQVDPQVIERGANWLWRELDSMDAPTHAFALYAITVAYNFEGVELDIDDPDNATILAENGRALLAATPNLDSFSRAALALAFWELGETTAANDLLDELLDTAEINRSAGTRFWSGASHDGHYHQKTMASDVRTTAFVLSAVARIRPASPAMPDIVRYLLSQRRHDGWGTTNETSFTIIGLTDYLLAVRATEAPTPFNYTVLANGQVVAEGSLSPTAASTTVEIPLAALQTGENNIRLEYDGTTPLYYALRSNLYLAQAEISAAGPLVVGRTYLNLDGTPADLSQLAVGQLVNVRLTVNNNTQLSYVLIEDTLPGGFEALNSQLNSQPRATTYYQETYYWQDYGYNYKEIRADSVSFFVTDLYPGQHIYSYTARITHSGTFVALPAQAYAMYELDKWGRSASAALTVR